MLLIADQFKWIIHGLVEVKCSITDKDETLSCRSVFFFPIFVIFQYENIHRITIFLCCCYDAFIGLVYCCRSRLQVKIDGKEMDSFYVRNK